MVKTLQGRIWVFGDDIDTDQIFPGPYLALTKEEDIAQHAMEGTEKGRQFITQAKPGDIIVAGENFGSGSSREHAPLSIKLKGITVVIAKSFARIFYRNAINIGLPIITADLLSYPLEDRDLLTVEWPQGNILIVKQGLSIQGEPPIGVELEIIASGGIINYLKTHRT